MSLPEEQTDPAVCPEIGAHHRVPPPRTRGQAGPPPAARPIERPGDGPEVQGWIRRAQSGDRNAFELLVTHFQDRVWRRALYRLGDYDEAADLAQDVFLICFRKIDQFRGEAKFWTWLCRIVDNQVKNRQGWLARRGKGKTFSLDAPPGQREGDERGWDPPDPGADPRRRAENREAMEALEAKLGLLSAEHREIVLLRFADGLSYEEIAENLELSLGTVKSRINRARAGLRTLLAEHLED